MDSTPDLDTMRMRYEFERGRRIRPEGHEQYTYYDHPDDPWVPPTTRKPLYDRVDTVIIGAGLSGLTCAALLRNAGIERIRLIDRAGDVGGVWYWNRYPAAQCDIESYIYLPLLEEMGYIPTEKYVYQPEILAYLRSISEKFELDRDALFQTDVSELLWNDEQGDWTILTNRGDAVRAQFVVVAGGFLQRPKLPGIPGLDNFKGIAFHSSRWDYGFTGGSPGSDGGSLPNLREKSVGLIGTAASGLQLVPPLAKASAHLYVFQRTPVVVLPRNNRPTDPHWARSLRAGWQSDRIESFNRIGNAAAGEPDPVSDEWTKVVLPMMASLGASFSGDPEKLRTAEMDDLIVMNKVRKRISETVKDPAAAALLMPYFRMLCKRPSFHDEYLQSYNRSNVTLVDTEGKGPERISERTVVVAGREYDVDCLIFATGYDTSRGLLKSWGLEIAGNHGIQLSDYWNCGLRTFQGIHVRNFPNCFFNAPTQNSSPPNYTSNVLEISRHIVYIIEKMRRLGFRRVEATAAAEESWAKMVDSRATGSRAEFLHNCTPGYFNNEGDIDSANRLGATSFRDGSSAFYEALRNWRRVGKMDGLKLA